MKRSAVFVFVAVCALSALSLAEDEEKAATVAPAIEFSPSVTLSHKTTTKDPITKPPTTKAPTTKAPTTKAPTTKAPTTKAPTTKAPTTKAPTTKAPTTKQPTTKQPTTKQPTTKQPTTKQPTTKQPTTTPPKPTPPKPTPPKPTPPKPTPPKPTPPQPTPTTNFTVGNYTLKKDESTICLMAQMALKIRLVQPKENGTFIIEPKSVTVQGDCKEPKANLTLSFKEGFITFLFNMSSENNTVYVHTVSFNLTYPLVKDENKFSRSNSSLRLFTAKVGHSYSCKSESVYMGNGMYLDVDKDRMQAFNLTKSNEFGLPDPCAADQPDYRVAVAVGVTLLVLIVIVVVAYLLGRRRRTDGYQTL